MSKLRVGFDLDGVLYNFGDSVRAYLSSIGREYGWKDNAVEPHHWDFYEYWHMTREEFVQVCHDGVDAGYIFSGATRPGAAETVNCVADMGHEIVIITDRFFGTPVVWNNEVVSPSHTATENWLAEHGIPYDELHFSPNKLIAPTDFFIEDKLENYDALNSAGVKSFLVNRPWNQVEGGDARNRINELIDYCFAIEGVFHDGFIDLTLA